MNEVLKNQGRLPDEVEAIRKQLGKFSKERLDALIVPLISGYMKKHEADIRLMSCFIDITYKCNLNCPHCVYKKKLNSSGESMTVDEFDSIITKLKDEIKTFFILGGEPFLNLEVIKRFAAYPDLLFIVFTNGTQIDESMVSWLKNVPNIVLLFSIDGQPNDCVKHKVNMNVDEVLHSIESARHAGIVCGVATVLHEELLSKEYNSNFISLLNSYGVNFVLYLFDQVMMQGENYIEKYDAFSRSGFSRSPIPAINLPFDEFLANYKHCMGGNAFFHILMDGTFGACPYTTKTLGRIQDLTYQQIKDILKASPHICPYRENRILGGSSK
jgi:MoaA/NifB/PqqE/SkfB family radical SAM enzyme